MQHLWRPSARKLWKSFTDIRSRVSGSAPSEEPVVSDSPHTTSDGGAPPSDEMDAPDEANEEDFTADEVTEATPPNAEEGEEAPEAG